MDTHAYSSVRLSALLVLITTGVAAFAQQQPAPTKPSDSAPPGADQSLLRGPTVNDDAVRSLVHLDIMGRFQRIEGRPEEAAIGMLALDSNERQQAREVIAERAATLSAHLVNNIDLVKESTDAIRAGDAATSQRLSRELYDRFDPAQSRDPLLAPLKPVLTPELTAELERLVDEYWTAWIDAEQRIAPQATREAIQQRLVFELYQTELNAVYEATLRPFQQKLERIYEAVDPTPEQRAAIRSAVISYIKAAHLTPSDEQREQLARTIYAALDEDRRIKLLAAALSAI